MVTAKDILSVRGVTVEFQVGNGVIRAVDDVSLDVREGETLAVVGESGCGKTTLAKAILGLQATAKGEIEIAGQAGAAKTGRSEIVGMVWQDPFASIDPQWPVRRIISEAGAISGKSIDVDSLLTEVGLSPEYAARYPHQMSGGQRQRVAIGRALALRPPLVICDEPTAALDLSIQAQILNLLKDLQQSRGCSFLYISHDLMTVRYLADRIAVMYLGQIVETGRVADVFASPKHPYTKSLLDSAPSLDRLGELPKAAAGEIPDPTQIGRGCRFASRCPLRQDQCEAQEPEPTVQGDRSFRCYNPLP